MKRIKAIYRAAMKDPRTTAAAIASLVALGTGIYQNLELLAKPETWSTILIALGVLLSADSIEAPPNAH
jgi:hypothetical protein